MIIVGACCKGGGVGYKGKLPWKNRADMKHFRDTTMGHTLLVGRKTAENMPSLKGRNVITLSRTNGGDLDDFADSDFLLIGGSEVWKCAFEKGYVTRIILTYISIEYKCDAFFPMEELQNFTLDKIDKLDDITAVFYYSKKMN